MNTVGIGKNETRSVSEERNAWKNGTTRNPQLHANSEYSNSSRPASAASGATSSQTEENESSSTSSDSTDYDSDGEYDAYGRKLKNVAYMKKPVTDISRFYNMNHPRRGKAVIFNFDRWDNTGITRLEKDPRKGSRKDKKDLTACLQKLDFEVAAYNNCSRRKVWKILHTLQKEDHSDADCLVVAIFTHGAETENSIIVGDGREISVNSICEKFEADHCPTLAGKPKIFIIQACRGFKCDNGTMLTPDPKNIHDETDFGSYTYTIPNAADIIVAFSCPLGQRAWRDAKLGSWFIQAICKVFNENAYKMELQSLFTTVAREVALNHDSYTPDEPETHEKKQMTYTCSTLMREVWFSPKRQKEQVPDIRDTRDQVFNEAQFTASCSGLSCNESNSVEEEKDAELLKTCETELTENI